jgi:predicted transcriptional regulator
MMMNAAERAVAHCEISNLLSLYYQALDVGDLDTLEREVMAEDATWELVQLCGSERVVDKSSGRDQVLDWFRTMLASGVSMTEGTVRHYLSTHVIRIEEAAAHSTSHLQAIETTGMTNVASGFVEADHVLTAAGWRIRRYKVEETITAKDMEALKATFGYAGS